MRGRGQPRFCRSKFNRRKSIQYRHFPFGLRAKCTWDQASAVGLGLMTDESRSSWVISCMTCSFWRVCLHADSWFCLVIHLDVSNSNVNGDTLAGCLGNLLEKLDLYLDKVAVKLWTCESSVEWSLICFHSSFCSNSSCDRYLLSSVVGSSNHCENSSMLYSSSAVGAESSSLIWTVVPTLGGGPALYYCICCARAKISACIFNKSCTYFV